MGFYSFLCRNKEPKTEDNKVLETNSVENPRNNTPRTVSIRENVFDVESAGELIIVEEKKFCSVYGIWRLVRITENGDVVCVRDASEREASMLDGYNLYIESHSGIRQV